MKNPKTWLPGLALVVLLAWGISTDFVDPAHVRLTTPLTAANRGADVAIHVGDFVTVKLPANSATGYRWTIVEKPECIELKADEFSDVNSQHFEFLTFASDRQCEGKLVLRYGRPWQSETGDDSKTYWVRIIVSS